MQPRLRGAFQRARAGLDVAGRQRDSTHSVASRTSRAISAAASRSECGAGREAGLDDVDAEFGQRARHHRSFCCGDMLQPGDCSPSRRVVSKMRMRAGAGRATSPGIGAHAGSSSGISIRASVCSRPFAQRRGEELRLRPALSAGRAATNARALRGAGRVGEGCFSRRNSALRASYPPSLPRPLCGKGRSQAEARAAACAACAARAGAPPTAAAPARRRRGCRPTPPRTCACRRRDVLRRAPARRRPRR